MKVDVRNKTQKERLELRILKNLLQKHKRES